MLFMDAPFPHCIQTLRPKLSPSPEDKEEPGDNTNKDRSVKKETNQNRINIAVFY